MRLRFGIGSAAPAGQPKPRLIGYFPVSASGAFTASGAPLRGAAQVSAAFDWGMPNAWQATMAVSASGSMQIRWPASFATTASGALTVRNASGWSATFATAASGQLNTAAGPAWRASLATAASGTLTNGSVGFLNGYGFRRLIMASPQTDLTNIPTLTDFPLFIDSTSVPGDWSWLVAANGKLQSVVGAAANPYALVPAYATDWSLLKATASPSISQLASGVTLAGGTAGNEAVNNIAIISKTKNGSTWSVRFTTMKTDANQATAGVDIFMLFLAGLVGDGTVGFPADVSTWSGSTEPYSHTFRDHCNGFRLSLHFQNTANQSETQNIYCAAFNASASPVIVAADAGSAGSFPMLQNVSYDWTVAFDGAALTVTQTDPSGTVRTNTYTNATLAAKAAAAGSFGLQCSGGRTVRVTGFAPTAAGGTSARDIRFEDYTTNAKLDHQVAAFDGTAGTARIWVRLPSWDISRRFLMWMYYGKAGLTSSEENIANVWVGAASVRDWTDGADITGRGRSYTSTSGITSTTINGVPGGTFSATSFARLSSPPNWDNGLPGVTTEYLMALSAIPTAGNGHRTGGTTPGTGDFSEFFTGGLLNSGWIPVDASGSRALQYNACEVAAADVPSDGSAHVWHFTRQSGRDCQVFKDGGKLTTAFAGTTQNTVGTLAVIAGDVECFGAPAGSVGQSSAIPGTFGPEIVWPFVMSDNRIAVSGRAQMDCGSVVSVGSEDAPGDVDQSPVGAVLQQTITAQTDVDVLPSCFDPNVGATLSLTAVTAPTPSNATYSIFGNKVRVAPNAGASATDEPIYTFSDGTKTAKAKLILPINSPVVVSGYFKTPNIARKTSVPVTSASVLQTVLGQFSSGHFATSTHYIEITQDFATPTTNVGDININVGGTRAHPLVITMAGAGTDTGWSSRPTVWNSAFVIKAPWVWLYGVQMSMLPTGIVQWRDAASAVYPGAMVMHQADNGFVTASRLAGSRGIVVDNGRALANNCTQNFNWFDASAQSVHPTGGGDWGVFQVARSGPNVSTGWISARNRFSDNPFQISVGAANFRAFETGDGFGDGLTYRCDWAVEYNFIDASVSHAMEFKTSIATVRWNHCTGRGNTYGGIYYRGGNVDGGIFAYNRWKSQHTNFDGSNATLICCWQVDSSGLLAGDFQLPQYCQKAPGGKFIRGADGLKMIACKANVVFPYYFEFPSYDLLADLGSRGNILFSGHAAGNLYHGTKSASYNTLGPQYTFDGNGHPNGTTPDLVESAVTNRAFRATDLPAGYTIADPPILNATVCGPGAAGQTWS